MAIYRVVFHDQGEPWYGLHEVEFDDAGQVAWWNREIAGFKCFWAMKWPHMEVNDDIYEVYDVRNDKGSCLSWNRSRE